MFYLHLIVNIFKKRSNSLQGCHSYWQNHSLASSDLKLHEVRTARGTAPLHASGIHKGEILQEMPEQIQAKKVLTEWSFCFTRYQCNQKLQWLKLHNILPQFFIAQLGLRSFLRTISPPQPLFSIQLFEKTEKQTAHGSVIPNFQFLAQFV